MTTIKFGIPDVPYSQVEFVAGGEEAVDEAIMFASLVRSAFLEAFPERATAPTPASQRPAARPTQPAQGGGKFATRADQYPEIPGMHCDVCGGPVGRYAKTGRMTSDKGVCLGKCKDGQYVHTVGWLNDEDPDDLPF